MRVEASVMEVSDKTSINNFFMGFVCVTVVLYSCETLSLTLRDKHRLRVFENRVLRIFTPKRDEVTGGWRKLHIDELCDLYFSPSGIRIIKSRRMGWARHVARIGAKRNLYSLLVGKPQENILLGKKYVDVCVILN
jgi:hypothetical protein